MSRFPHDEFAKDYLKVLLEPLGTVDTSRKVKAEIRDIDVYFVRSFQVDSDVEGLGLLGRFAENSALFEAFRNAAQPDEIISCMNKYFDTYFELKRQKKDNEKEQLQADVPRLWILSPTASEIILNGFNTTKDEKNWSKGIYFLGSFLRTAIVVIHQLPVTQDTLWLRLLGRGKVQAKAVEELEALPEDNPLRSKAFDVLLNLKATLELNNKKNKDDERLIMALSPIYSQKLAEARQEGRQIERRTTIENLLRTRFGSLDEDLRTIVEPLSALSPEEFSVLLLQLSREELLARFNQ